MDEKACTLCLACVTACPGKALMHGQDLPQLRFLEANCVQCGLCTRTCPEDAIWISPRFLFDAQARGHLRVLREDSPFHCVRCGKPNMVRPAVIRRMQQRLAGHSMFQDSRARRRLQMCGDCRGADLMLSQELWLPMRRLWQREKTFWGRLAAGFGLLRELTEADFAEWQEMTYDSCTLCGRCSMVCPVGNEIAYMIRAQGAAFAAGYSPQGCREPAPVP